MRKFIGFTGFILIWQIAAMYVGSKVFPTPAEVIMSFINNPGVLLIHCAYSIYRMAAGVLLALAVGLPLGLLLGYFEKANQFFSPALYIAAPIPKIALLPLIMIFFGIGNLSKIFIIFIIMVFQVIVTVRDGVSKIPPEYFLSCMAAKADTPFLFRHIIFPAALPNLFTSLRIGLATSVSALFFAESFGTKWGVGFFVMDMWMRLDYKQMYTGIIAFGLIGFLSAALTDKLERALCPWSDTDMH